MYVDGKFFEVTGVGYAPKGEFKLGDDLVKPEGDVELLLRIGAVCNNAQLRRKEETDSWEIFGDPTEGALIVAAEKATFVKESLGTDYPRVREIRLLLKEKG
jgi:Ca2+-transporting ATPase